MKLYKSFLVIGLCLASMSGVKAQQMPVMNQYIYNPYLYNPARTGMSTLGNAFISFRKQWSGMPDAPLTGYATFDSRLKDSNIGMGGMLFSDNTHVLHNMGGAVSYAYHIPFNDEKTHQLSIGLQGGVIHQRFDFTEAVVTDPNDPTISADNERTTTFNMAAGINYNWKGLNVGFAMPQLFTTKFKYRDTQSDSIRYKLQSHLFASVSYEAQLGKKKEWKLTPLAAIRWVKALPVQFDVDVLTSWKDMVWFGAGYRSANNFISPEAAGVNVTSGVGFKKRIGINYTMEFLTGKADRSSFGYTHEVSINYKIGNRYEKEFQRLADAEKKVAEVDAKVDRNKEEGDEKDSVLQGNLDANNGDLDKLKDQVKDNTSQIEKMNQIMSEYKAGTAVTYKKLGSAYFKLDSYELTADGMAALNALKDPINKFSDNSFVYLVGNASEEAGNMYNMLLATQRAASVKKYMESIGIHKEVLILTSGEEAPVNGQKNEQERALNRRVDILISGE